MSPVLVIGGSRGTGRLIVELLVQQQRAVRVLARNADRARTQLPGSVNVLEGDLTKPESLAPAIEGAAHIILTAGVRSGRPSGEARIKATEYNGVLNVLEEARRVGFFGRFMYMTASSVGSHSVASTLLNLYKGNTLRWRLRAENDIRASGFNYTIIRAGFLLNARPDRRAILLTQKNLPLSPKYRIARGDVARAFVASLDHPKTHCATFDVVWDKGPRREPWSALLDRVHPDADFPAA